MKSTPRPPRIFATKRHLALALDTTPEEVVDRFAEASSRRVPSTGGG